MSGDKGGDGGGGEIWIVLFLIFAAILGTLALSKLAAPMFPCPVCKKPVPSKAPRCDACRTDLNWPEPPELRAAA